MQAALTSYQGFRPCVAAPRAVARSSGMSMVCQRQSLVVRASAAAPPVPLPVKTLDGSSAGTASIALRVADEDTAKGLVHRYLVMVRQNARQVRGQCSGHGGGMRGAARPAGGMRLAHHSRPRDSDTRCRRRCCCRAMPAR